MEEFLCPRKAQCEGENRLHSLQLLQIHLELRTAAQQTPDIVSLTQEQLGEGRVTSR